VGPRIAAVREELGFNQTQMAKFLGVHRSRYAQWEAGRHLPRDELAILRLCEMTDVTLDWLYRGSLAGMPSALGLRLESRVAGAPPPR
jgi:transcriptional regulator with XRE-family HTH domain